MVSVFHIQFKYWWRQFTLNIWGIASFQSFYIRYCVFFFFSGFYVRILLYYGNKLVKTKQTLTQLALPEVNFNESFAFSTSNKNIENFSFIVTLVKTDRHALSNDVELGHVTLGSFMYARGAGLIHWQEMLAKTRNVIAKWHPLNLPV